MTATIKYQGRQARREGSEQRRKAILEAALRIIISDGIRSVRHRAVAKEADVPLSATTYYFKDIHELIADSFTLFAERAMEEVVKPFQREALNLMEEVPNADSAEGRQQLVDVLAGAISAYIEQGAHERRDHNLAEQAFYQEAMIEDGLRRLAVHYRQEQIKVLHHACERLRVLDPQLAAELIFNQVLAWEQELLLNANAFGEGGLFQRAQYLLRLVVSP